MQRTTGAGEIRRGNRRRRAGRRRRLANFGGQAIQIVRRRAAAWAAEIDDAVIAGSRLDIACQPTADIGGANISVLTQAEEGSIIGKGDDDIASCVQGRLGSNGVKAGCGTVQGATIEILSAILFAHTVSAIHRGIRRRSAVDAIDSTAVIIIAAGRIAGIDRRVKRIKSGVSQAGSRSA